MATQWTHLSNISWLQEPPLAPVPATQDLNINSEIIRTLTFVCYSVIGQSIALFGISTNIINIICFSKMGFKESINNSLLSLAISDLCCLLTVLFTNASMVPAFQDADLPFDPLGTQYLTAGIPHLMFTRVTAVITAFITLERCLCVTLPLKIKSIFTHRRVAIINASIFLSLILTCLPIFFGSSLGMVYIPERNRTVLKLLPTAHRAVIETVSLAINSVLIPFSALLIIIVCMVTMAIKLQEQAKWRQTHRGPLTVDASSDKELRLVKMIVMISTLFVVCFCPNVVLLFVPIIEPEFNVGGKYASISIFIYGFSSIAESTNSSMNIFIYYNMSSKYRSHLWQMLHRKNKSTPRTESSVHLQQ